MCRPRAEGKTGKSNDRWWEDLVDFQHLEGMSYREFMNEFQAIRDLGMLFDHWPGKNNETIDLMVDAMFPELLDRTVEPMASIYHMRDGADRPGRIRTGIQLPEDSRSMELDIYTSQGEFLCRLGIFEFLNGEGTVDVYTNDTQTRRVLAMSQGSDILDVTMPMKSTVTVEVKKR